MTTASGKTHRLLASIQRKVIEQLNIYKIRIFLLLNATLKGQRFAVIVSMPQAAHLSVICYQHLTKQRPDLAILIVENELSSLESHSIRRLCNNKNTFHLSIYCKPLRHDQILNSLIYSARQDFWIVDHDCLVFSGSALKDAEQQAVQAGCAGVYFFGDKVSNNELGLIKPHTFLMFLGAKQLRRICKKYKVSTSPQKWQDLSMLAQRKLSSLGFSQDKTPENGKDFWDTFSIICFLSIADQVGFMQAADYSAWFASHDIAVHFGNTSYPSFEKTPPPSPHINGWGYRSIGAYYWRLCLDSIDNFPAKQQYLETVNRLPSCHEMRNILIQGGISAATIDYINSIFTAATE